MRITYLLVAAGCFLSPCHASAQDEGLEAVLAPHIYSPWVILENRERLDLSEDQSDAIVDLMTEAERVIVPAQAEMRRRIQTLVRAVSGDSIDVDEAIAFFDEVMREEARIKRQHMLLLLKSKNLLNPEQQGIMQKIQEETSGLEGTMEVGE